MSPTLEEILDRLYGRFHRPEFIHPDPLEKVREVPREDREVAGLIASSLALGRVGSILDAVDKVLARLASPREAVVALSRAELGRLFADFRYRFVSGEQLAALLYAAGECIRRYGTIEGCFLAGMDRGDESVLPALTRFVAVMTSLAGRDLGILLSDPEKRSACKRLHLYLRWMVRRDEIDPGGWSLPCRLLLVPVDVHMLRVSRILGLTARRQADLIASLEITRALRELSPEDPVKYDFAMTRLGIHPELSYDDLIEKRS